MYQVWTKEVYEEAWRLTDCPDIAAVERVIRDNFGKEVEVKVTTPVEFDAKITVKINAPEEKLSIKERFAKGVEVPIKEVKGEATESETEPDKGARAKSHRTV